jgi:homoserine dehydrogenase
MAERSIGIALLGCGVVGAGVVELLTRQHDLLRQRTGLTFDLRHIVVRDLAKHRAKEGGGEEKAKGKGQKAKGEDRSEQPALSMEPGAPAFSTDALAAISDPKVDIVIELIGGTTAAGEYVEAALKAGKSVVTANKSLLAARGPDLFRLARRHDAAIAFEASCGGGVPIINALLHGLVANRIDALVGIVNGTCNFILTKMTRNGWSYADALKEAQKAGFAEADPTMDVSGRDAAQKLAILAGLAFNARVSESDVHVEGIDTLSATDIAFAGELGYVIKLLAIAERKATEDSGHDAGMEAGGPESAGHGQAASGNASSLCLRVHPTLVHKSDVLADVSGSFNAISLYGHALGHALFYGRGAGQMPTASAVVADLVNTAMGTVPLAFRQLQVFTDATPPARILPFADLRSRYYLHLMANDRPGVLAQITKILGQHEISLSAILQHEVSDGQCVPVVITTHLAHEGSMQAAVREIDQLPTIKAPTVCLRIIDQPKEFGIKE